MLLASNHVPSLGLIFETFYRARRSLLTFFGIFLLFLTLSVFAFHYLYGFKDGNFESLQKCYSTLFKTLNSGDLPYDEMYNADPMLAGTTATMFIFVVVFFSQYFIVGIIIETYT